MMGTVRLAAILALISCSLWSNCVVNAARLRSQQRNLETVGGYYHSLTVADLGAQNPDVAIGNPLKGLMPCPQYSRPPYHANMPHSLEFFYVGLKQVMVGNPDVVGNTKAFNWTAVENILDGSASRNAHAVLRFYVVYPGRELEVPQYLINAGVELRTYTEDDYINEQSPYFGDKLLLKALEQFVINFGKKYDGHPKLGHVQAGLLGFWGEWHSMGKGFIPEEVEDQAVGWYAKAFFKTQVQFRYPSAAVREAGFGLHDDSFAFETVDGPANGGQYKSFYTWPRVVKYNMTNFWKTAAFGGETRTQIANEIFEPTYAANTLNKQDFLLAVNTTHMSYTLHMSAFRDGGYTGVELANARHAHARMGYNFHVPTISVRNSTRADQVDVHVTVAQIGVAPFYYDLNLTLECDGMITKNVHGVETVIENGASKKFQFNGVPATSTCLRAMTLKLASSYAYAGRPIKFAQRDGTLIFNLPLPGTATHAPTLEPTRQPSRAPATFSPTVSIVTRLTLINADSDQDIRPLTNGMIVNLSAFPRVTVRADPDASFRARSVVFKHNGVVVRTDNGAPFAIERNSGNNYTAWSINVGEHTVIATPFSAHDANGTAGVPAVVSFTVVKDPVAPTKAPVVAPRHVPTTSPLSPKVPPMPVSAPVPTSPSPINTGSSGTKLTLINADTDLDISPMTNGMTINLLVFPSLNIRADAAKSCGVRSVEFKHNGLVVRIDNGEPYAFKKNTGNNYSSWTPTLGVHTLVATPFESPDANGTACDIATVTFTVVSRSVVSTLPPVQAPTKVPVRAPTQEPLRAPTKAPVRAPTKAPVRAPTKVPVRAPTQEPLRAPTKAPVRAPTKAPVRAPTKAPVHAPTKAPVRTQTKAPVRTPTKAPVRVPTKAPVRALTKAPVKIPTKAPVKIPTKAPVKPSPTKPSPTKPSPTKPSPTKPSPTRPS